MARALALLVLWALADAGVDEESVTFENWQPICESNAATCGWPAGASMRIGAELMVERINAGPGFMRGGRKLILRVEDTQCSGDEGRDKSAQLLMLPRQQWPFGVIGCGCTSCSFKAVPIMSLARVPIISQSSTSVGLSDRTRFPHFFRIQPPDQPLVLAFLSLYRDEFGWRQLAMVINVELQESWGAWWEDTVAKRNITDLLMDSSLRAMRDATPESAQKALAEVKRVKARGVVMIAFAPFVRQIACEISKQRVRGLVVSHFGWFSPSWVTENLGDHGCSAAAMEAATNHFINANAPAWNAFSTPLPCDPLGNWTVGDFAEEYHRRRLAQGLEWRTESSSNADAVCMMAMLFNSLLDDGVTAKELHHMDDHVFKKALALMQRTSFEGVSGPVAFPADGAAYGGGDRVGSSDVFQRVNGANLKVAFVQNGGVTLHPGGTFLFADGYNFSHPPPELFPSCPQGEVYNFTISRCLGCGKGQAYVAAVGECLAKPGFFEDRGEKAVAPCAAGSFSSSSGATVCEACELGRFSAGGSSHCNFCPRGSFSSERGAANCTLCGAGTTTKDIASVAVSQCVCGAGLYEKEGDGCLACPKGSSTDGVGHTDVRECYCEETTYMPGDFAECRECPQGMLCPRGASESNFEQGLHKDPKRRPLQLQFPILQPGYYSGPEFGLLEVFQCRDDKHCPGGDPGKNGCASDLIGTSCEHCIEGLYWDGQQCRICGGVQLFPTFPIFLVPVITLLLYKMKWKEMLAARWDGVANARNALIFVMLNDLQVLSLTRGAVLAFPSSIAGGLGYFDWSTDASIFFNLQCTGYRRFRPTLVMRTLAPAVLTCLMAAVWSLSWALSKVARTEGLQLSADRIFNVWGTAMFSFFSAIGALSLMLFNCSSNPNGKFSLSYDRSVMCYYDREWYDMLGVAAAAVLVYLVGMGALFTRTVIRAPQPGYFENPRFQTRWAFLFIRYRPEAYWFSIIFLAKNFLVNLGFVLFSDGLWQLYWVFTTLCVYSAFVVAFAPYRSRWVWKVELLVSASLLHTTSLLTWFSDRGINGTQFDADMGTAVGVWTSLPLALGLLAAACVTLQSLLCYAQTIDAQNDAYEDVHLAAEALGSLPAEVGMDFFARVGEWDRILLSEGGRCVKVELLGHADRWRTSDKRLASRFVQMVEEEAAAEAAAANVVEEPAPVVAHTGVVYCRC